MDDFLCDFPASNAMEVEDPPEPEGPQPPKFYQFFRDNVESASVHEDIGDEQYRAETGVGEGLWLTRSILSDFIDSPTGFYLRHIDKYPLAEFKRTEAMDGGTYFDILVTHGEEAFRKHYVRPEYLETPKHWFTPSGGISTRKEVRIEISDAIEKGKVFREVPESRNAFSAKIESQGKELLNEKREEQSLFMQQQLLRNPLASRIIETSKKRQMVVRVTLKDGTRIQCKPDFYSKEFRMVSDLKTTFHREKSWLSDAINRNYHIQWFLYPQLMMAAGIELAVPFQYICQMNRYPWESYVTEIPPDVEKYAAAQTINAIQAISGGEQPPLQTKSRVPHCPMWLHAKIDTD